MVYLASPFFDAFEVTVKEEMVRAVKKKFDLTDTDLFNPEDSDASKKYGKEDGTSSDRFKLAKEIYKDNVEGISNCDFLVFPKYTTDLGTLWEVGYAVGIGKKVYRYNFLTKGIEEVNYKPIEYPSLVNVESNISVTFDAVRFGILSANKIIAPNLIYSFYENTGLKDNIMLAANFRFRDSNGTILNPEDRNWKGGIL